MTQTRRRFLTNAFIGRRCRLVARSPAPAAEGVPSKQRQCGIPKGPAICGRLRNRRGTASRRRLYRCPLCGYIRRLRCLGGDRPQQARYRFDFRGVVCSRQSMPAKRSLCWRGVHVGCFELFGREEIRTIAELKGKTVGFEIGVYPARC